MAEKLNERHEPSIFKMLVLELSDDRKNERLEKEREEGNSKRGYTYVTISTALKQQNHRPLDSAISRR